MRRSGQSFFGTCRSLFVSVTVLVLLSGLFHPSLILVAGDLVFSIPLENLNLWSQKITVSMDVNITGHSKVHSRGADCEMHFGGRSEMYKGDPPGLVLEPMNLCVQPFFGKQKYSKTDWKSFGDALKGKMVHVEGVPRIWPEHLRSKENPSDPHHAFELHPLTMIKEGSVIHDFSSFIFDPSGYKGGVKPKSSSRILNKASVSVVNRGGMVEVTCNSGMTGNFTLLHFTIFKDSIENGNGGHRMDGEVQVANGGTIKVRLLTVAGSPADDAIAKLKTQSEQQFEMDSLVLLSLSPEALFKAAQQSTGDSIPVQNPIQLIVFGGE